MQPEPVWLMAGKQPGKNYRPDRFVPHCGCRASPAAVENR
jgi:hypothetical protein